MVTEMAGKTFGRLKVLRKATRTNACQHAYWVCRCECGTVKEISGAVLRNGAVVSCGCLKDERARETMTKHSMSGTATYHAWAAMIQRCTNPKNPGFHRYGGRGVKVCKRWLKFENFLADMGERPSPDLSLDRIDNDGDYKPSNCRWATWLTQCNNQRGSTR